ncbi:outer membrane protein [Sphingomonas sp.]|uniref:outer membrane protein n=1 Tax=Sphingomonas sp. TaxID=28214 RepID=UPI0035C8733B
MRKFLLAGLAATCGAIAAQPALAEAGAFSGPRAEVVLGYDQLNSKEDGESGHKGGFGYGARLGYDLQSSGFVYGVEVGVAGSSIKESESDIDVTGDRLTLKAGRDLYAGVRVGAVVTPSTLLYARAGYTNARLSLEYKAPNLPAVTAGRNKGGFRAGAGVEHKLVGSSYVLGEYDYSTYGSFTDDDLKINRHQLLAGVGIRF